MKYKLIYSFLLCALFSGNGLIAGRKDCKSLTHGADIYKHFVGTIGKKKVALDLRFGYCGGSNYGGSYLYEAGSKYAKYLIIGESEKYEYDAPLLATEYLMGESWKESVVNRDYKLPTWEFTIKDHRLMGKWYSGDKKEMLDIDLTEDYKDAYPMDIIVYRDSAKKYIGVEKMEATFDYIGVQPSAQMAKADADFINSQLLQFTGGDKMGARTLQDVPKAVTQQIFDEFRKNCLLVITDTPVARNIAAEGSDGFSLLFPVYNGDGFLSMEYEQFSNTPKWNNKSHTYECIDVKGKKIWHLNDMIADTAGLAKLLQDEYKSELKPDTRTALAANKVVTTEDVIVTQNGLAFCYAYFDDMHMVRETKIFVPYHKLKGLLTENFRVRMNL